MAGKVDKKIRQYVRRNMVQVSQELIAGMRNLKFGERWQLCIRILFKKSIDPEKTLFSAEDMALVKKDLTDANRALSETTANLNQARAMIWSLVMLQDGEVKVSIESLAQAQAGQFEFKHDKEASFVTVTAK